MKKCATCVTTLVGFHPTLALVGTPDLILCQKKRKLYTELSRFSHAHNFCSEIRQKDKEHRKQDTFFVLLENRKYVHAKQTQDK